MADTDFTDNDLAAANRVVAAWLNPVNALRYRANTGISGITAAMYLDGLTRNAYTRFATDFMTSAQRTSVAAFNNAVNVSAAVQSAIDALPSTGGTIVFPPGSYNLGTTGITITKLGVRLLGLTAEGSILYYTGTGAAVSNSSTTLRTHISLENLYIDISDSANGAGLGSGPKCVDFTYWSYSNMQHCLLDVAGNAKIGIYANGTSAGSSPYYNTFIQNDIIGTVGSTNTIGIFFDQNLGVAVDRGPNANTVIGGRFAGLSRGMWIKAGNGNRVISVDTESISVHHFQIGTPTADYTGTFDSGTIITGTDAQVMSGLTDGGLKITAGTASGQNRRILSVANVGADYTITCKRNFTTPLDATSAFSAFARCAYNNQITAGRAEGSSGSNFCRLEPGAFSCKIEAAEVASIGAGLTISQDIFDYEDTLRATPSMKDAISFTFNRDNIAAGLTDSALTIGGSTTTEYLIPFEADIVGITGRLSEQQTAQSAQFWPTVNGTKKTLSLLIDGNVRQSNDQVQVMGTDSMGGVSRRLGCVVTTGGGWTPTTADAAITIWLVPR